MKLPLQLKLIPTPPGKFTGPTPLTKTLAPPRRMMAEILEDLEEQDELSWEEKELAELTARNTELNKHIKCRSTGL
jgi:hypothetical protein